MQNLLLFCGLAALAKARNRRYKRHYYSLELGKEALHFSLVLSTLYRHKNVSMSGPSGSSSEDKILPLNDEAKL